MQELELTKFIETFDRIKENAEKEGRLKCNPSPEVMKELIAKQPGVKKTIYGNYVAESEPTSRSAMFTKNSVARPFGDDEAKLLRQCEEALGKE